MNLYDPFTIGLVRVTSVFMGLVAIVFYVCVARTSFGVENAWLTALTKRHGGLALQARIATALTRRRGNERTEQWSALCVVVLQLALCACSYFGIISPALAYALYFALLVAHQAVMFLFAGAARTGRRVASLRPRAIARIVPWWLVWLPAIGWSASLIIAWRTGTWLANVISVATSVGALALSFIMTSWPAILGDQDTAADEAIDTTLRSYRVRSLVFVAAITPIAVSQVIWVSHDLVVIIARLVCVFSYLPMTFWNAKAANTAQNDIVQLEHAS